MILSAVYVLVVAQSSSEVPEGLMNNPVFVANNDCTQEMHFRGSALARSPVSEE